MNSQVAIVTGAASGIGAALVAALVDRGVRVIATDIDGSALKLLEVSGQVQRTVLDVRDRRAVAAVVRDAKDEHGRLDYMFNNAGIVIGGDFCEMTEELWHRIVDVNLWGVVHGTEAAYGVMKAQGFGHIVNTASSAGVLPVARSVAYAATKHAVVGLSTSLRAESIGTGVRVSVVVPGVVDTAIFNSAANLGGYDYAKAIERVPFRKVAPARAAQQILAGVDRDQQFITFPAYNRALVGLHRIAPGVMSRVIN